MLGLRRNAAIRPLLKCTETALKHLRDTPVLKPARTVCTRKALLSPEDAIWADADGGSEWGVDTVQSSTVEEWPTVEDGWGLPLSDASSGEEAPIANTCACGNTSEDASRIPEALPEYRVAEFLSERSKEPSIEDLDRMLGLVEEGLTDVIEGLRRDDGKTTSESASTFDNLKLCLEAFEHVGEAVASALRPLREAVATPRVLNSLLKINELIIGEIRLATFRQRESINKDARINTLPVEVLTEVLDVAAWSGPLGRYLSLLRLGMVCSKWHRASLNAPWLWGFVDGRHYQLEALELAGNSPLSTPWDGLRITAGGRPQRQFRIWPEEKFGQWLVARAERWRSVHLTFDVKLLYLVQELAMHPGTLVEVCSINVPSYSFIPAERQIDLFHGKAPRLKVLHLSGIWVPITADYLRHVLDLRISDACYLPRDLLHVLEVNPHLTVLHVEDVLSPPDTIWMPQRPIRAEHLKDLILRGNAGLHILPHLDTPRCRRLEVECNLQDDPEAQAEAVSTYFLRRVTSASPDNVKIRWTFYEGAYLSEWSGSDVVCLWETDEHGGYTLDLNVHSNSPEAGRWIAFVARYLQPVTHKPVPLTLGSNERYPSRLDAAVLQALLDLPITTFTFHGSEFDFKEFMRGCRSLLPETAEGHGQQWPFPDLESITGYGVPATVEEFRIRVAEAGGASLGVHEGAEGEWIP